MLTASSLEKDAYHQAMITQVKQEKGFAVLISTVLLAMAAILFTANMAYSQLVNNQIVGNYYRNNEAFANAESGVNFVLSQLDDPQRAQLLLNTLPVTYNNSASHYRVQVDKLTTNRLIITSDATSVDGSAIRQINLEVEFYLNFPIPNAALSVNGKLNLDESALVNDGCEGLEQSDCLASGNVAEAMLVSNPNIEIPVDDDDCSGERSGENVIADNVLKGTSLVSVIAKTTTADDVERYNWEMGELPETSYISELPVDPDFKAGSLFEATFAIPMNADNLDKIWDNAAQIDTSYGGNCSDQFQVIDEEKEIIYIKGDCDISQYYTQQSKTSENKVFTIGSAKHPKLVFIEGGTFKTQPNTGARVVGMLYFLPGSHAHVDGHGKPIDLNGNRLSKYAEAIQVPDINIDMGGINVNGALLSEYKCSHDGHDRSNSNNTKQHFSARFDKLVLDKLYDNLGVKPTSSGYRIAAGTWRDF
ncbi:hypothetical protein GCM10007916_20060 [Psychromonas marina]|uniref:Type 4 fimbrial biogenesis protein PilX N-terminal domain-containing protein n=2 Tax=Psychromonas marina TaxID=88364 RepID=A0ABQ6E102_9GAMM|nr:hypothetical protein GCM10007916_20060 [Psychromonas marina]